MTHEGTHEGRVRHGAGNDGLGAPRADNDDDWFICMTGSKREEFDAGAYWRERVVSGADLAVVGHRSMGPIYNGEIYARRIEALENMLARHVRKPTEQLRVLDIGCGSGFYTRYWQTRGVRHYHGLDISGNTIDHLSKQYPHYSFTQADITTTVPDGLNQAEPFDVITVFDVLYHIVDNRRFHSAVVNVSHLVRAGGCVLVMDQLCRREYRLSRHVLYRDRTWYLSVFDKQELHLVGSELLFHFLVPPIIGFRFLDYPVAALYKLSGLLLRQSSRVTRGFARLCRRLDASLRKRGMRISNNELLAFRKVDPKAQE